MTCLLLFPLLQKIEQNLVVGHEHAGSFVQNRRVGEFLVGVAGRQNWDSGFVGRRPAHAGVYIPGGKCGRSGADQTSTTVSRPINRNSPAVLFGNHPTGKVEGSPTNVSVHIHSAGENNATGQIEHRGIGR
jgi:hypothetical protein